MMELVTLLSYILFSYGITTMLIYFNGPFDIIEYFRKTMNAIHPKLGELFRCPFCLSTWIGGLFSIINYLWIPIKITPFNMILAGSGLWWCISTLWSMTWRNSNNLCRNKFILKEDKDSAYLNFGRMGKNSAE